MIQFISDCGRRKKKRVELTTDGVIRVRNLLKAVLLTLNTSSFFKHATLLESSSTILANSSVSSLSSLGRLARIHIHSGASIGSHTGSCWKCWKWSCDDVRDVDAVEEPDGKSDLTSWAQPSSKSNEFLCLAREEDMVEDG